MNITLPIRYMTNPLSLKMDTSNMVVAFLKQLSTGLLLLFSGCSVLFCSASEDVLHGWITGLIRAPATQQLSISPPRMRRLPLQPNRSCKYWLRGARQDRNTGLPAMASPLAKGRLTRKYWLMMVTAALRLKESPQPDCREKKKEVTFPKPSVGKLSRA